MVLFFITNSLNLRYQIYIMDDNFSPRVKDVITYSKEEAMRLGMIL
jgi:ATP-dependent Clp protease ATP-binding subunit ClpC